MDAEQHVSVAHTDRERLDQLLTYLSEAPVRDFAYHLSIFPNYYGDFATAYYKYRRNIQESTVFTFTYPETQKAFVAFNTAIDLLYIFSLACLSHQYPNDPLLDEIFLPEGYLQVRTPNNQQDAQNELDTYADKFLSAYQLLLQTAIEGIKKQETDKRTENVAGAISKGKMRHTLPHFERTDWANVSVRFTGDTSVVISNKEESKPLTYEDLGCRDLRSDDKERPDDTWKFFLELAHGKGHTAPRPTGERETFKKRKQKLTDIFRKMFENDTDPFENDRNGVYRAKFAIEYPHPDNTIVTDAKYRDIAEVFDEMTAPRDEEREL